MSKTGYELLAAARARLNGPAEGCAELLYRMLRAAATYRACLAAVRYPLLPFILPRVIVFMAFAHKGGFTRDMRSRLRPRNRVEADLGTDPETDSPSRPPHPDFAKPASTFQYRFRGFPSFH